jgi:hypothetical protein
MNEWMNGKYSQHGQSAERNKSAQPNATDYVDPCNLRNVCGTPFKDK